MRWIAGTGKSGATSTVLHGWTGDGPWSLCKRSRVVSKKRPGARLIAIRMRDRKCRACAKAAHRMGLNVETMT